MVAGVMLLLPAAAGAQGADTTCQFALTRLDATTTNVLAVDTNAVYWGGTYAALPGTRIRIEGQYPHARYISWNVYDAAARPIDANAPRTSPRAETATNTNSAIAANMARPATCVARSFTLLTFTNLPVPVLARNVTS